MAKVTDPSKGGSLKDSLIGSATFSWDDNEKRNNIMFRVPRLIRWNDNIVVREDEIAVFYRDGKALTYFDRPDRYALTDINAPIVGTIPMPFPAARASAVHCLISAIFPVTRILLAPFNTISTDRQDRNR